VVLLRLALRTLRLAASGASGDAREYAADGVLRLAEAMDAYGDRALVRAQLELERRAWDAYFDAIDAIEGGDGTLAARAASIFDDCRVHHD
jgi:hypothetical protein